MIDPATIGTIAGVGTSLVGGLLGGGGGSSTDAAEEAAIRAENNLYNAQSNAYVSRDAALRQMYAGLNIAPMYLSPYLNAGEQGVNALTQLLTQQGGLSPIDMVSGLPPGAGADITNFLTQTPWYQGAMGEAQKALQNRLVSQGLGTSGAGAKALGTFLGNYYLNNALAPTMNNYQNYLGNYQKLASGLAGAGQNAANTFGNIRSAYDTGIGNIYNQSAQSLLAAASGGRSAYPITQPSQNNALAGALGGLGGLIANIPWNQIGNSLSGTSSVGTPSMGSAANWMDFM